MDVGKASFQNNCSSAESSWNDKLSSINDPNPSSRKQRYYNILFIYIIKNLYTFQITMINLIYYTCLLIDSNVLVKHQIMIQCQLCPKNQNK